MIKVFLLISVTNFDDKQASSVWKSGIVVTELPFALVRSFSINRISRSRHGNSDLYEWANKLILHGPYCFCDSHIEAGNTLNKHTLWVNKINKLIQ